MERAQAKTAKAIAAAKEERRKMNAKLAEYMSMFKAMQIETKSVVKKNNSMEKAADKAAADAVKAQGAAAKKTRVNNAKTVAILAAAEADRNRMQKNADEIVAA